MFGNNHLFVLHHPKDKELLAKREAAQKEGKPLVEPEQSYDKAQEEIAQNSGLLNYGDITDRNSTDKSAGNVVNSLRTFKPFKCQDFWFIRGHKDVVTQRSMGHQAPRYPPRYPGP